MASQQAVRTLKLSKGENADASKFPGNSIKTSKYTPATFVPFNLWEQLHKFGNVYFLLISILMYLGEHTKLFVGTIKAFSTILTLMMMMSVTALVAYLDDEQRKKADNLTNHQTTASVDVDSGKVTSKYWKDVLVGDVIRIEQDEELPADIVPVYCATEKGNAYVSTANLDGETNLKLKSAPACTQLFLGKSGTEPQRVMQQLQKMEAQMKAEAPRTSIHDFEGLLTLDREEESLSAKNILLRGTMLRNTPWCLGVVIYTGDQTRMVMNSRKAPLKQSNLEKVTNNMMIIILTAQGILALLSNLIFLSKRDEYRAYWYLYPPDLILPDWIGYWLTFFVLYSNMMPISLYPTMEICNSAQSYFIQNDKKMYYKELDFPAGVRSTNLCQEIGQVQYVFSDKTGTLTQNVMELKKLSINGKVYGTLVEGEKGFNGGAEMKQRRRESKDDEKAMDLLLEIMGVAHTAMVSYTKPSPTDENAGYVPLVGSPQRRYEVESPDEGALVEGAAELGWTFEARDGDDCIVRTDNGQRRYTILATNEFSSARKRMSCVVRYGEQTFVLAKGADNVMLERAAKKETRLEKQLEEFSCEGLRTLVYGRRTLTPEEFSNWQSKYKEALNSLTDREGKLEAVAASIEKNFEIVGASAIEDKLQEGVPESIVKIRKAGVKLWVLTGDKLETARNIGFSSQVLTQSMMIAILGENGGGNIKNELSKAEADVGNAVQRGNDAAIMVTGAALDVILPEETMGNQLFEIARKCKVLIACRVSPLQKADMVKLVRRRLPEAVTLSIGDGANDVPMIQEANVGIGIAGREGRQAVNNSDFAIGQFRYLERLMLVHGRWNYRRVCKFTLFTFWRNAVQVLMIFYYTFSSGFSGTSLFEDWIRLSFNFLCSFPIMATGIFDQDVSEEVALNKPELYKSGREGHDLNWWKITHSLLCAVAHSLILLFLTMLAFPSMDLHGAGDYYTFGTAVFTCLLIDMNYRVAFISCTHNRWTVGSIIVSFTLYVVYLIVYPSSPLVTSILAPNMYMVPLHMAKVPIFWMTIATVPLIAVTVDAFIAYMFQTFDSHNKEVVEAQAAEDGSAGQPLCSNAAILYKLLTPFTDKSEEGAEPLDSTLNNRIDTSLVAQQKTLMMRTRSVEMKFVSSMLVLIGFALLCFGGWAVHCSMSEKQIRIHYEGPDDYDPWGTDLKKEVIRAQDKCEGKKSCTFDATIVDDMRPPILVYYAVGPLYQNYNDYLKSEVSKELHGVKVPESLRETMCIKPTRVDDQGRDIVPCGMKATSVFNDTFSVEGYDIDKKAVGWMQDMERYKNPPDYPDRKKTSWLYERYPDVVKKDEGMDNPQFVAWMRPSALARVWNPYGLIRKPLKAGQKLKVTVNSIYPVDKWKGYKHLVFTTIGPMGGRHNGFGLGLICSGVGCFLAAITVVVVDCIKPRLSCC